MTLLPQEIAENEARDIELKKNAARNAAKNAAAKEAAEAAAKALAEAEAAAQAKLADEGKKLIAAEAEAEKSL